MFYILTLWFLHFSEYFSISKLCGVELVNVNQVIDYHFHKLNYQFKRLLSLPLLEMSSPVICAKCQTRNVGLVMVQTSGRITMACLPSLSRIKHHLCLSRKKARQNYTVFFPT